METLIKKLIIFFYQSIEMSMDNDIINVFSLIIILIIIINISNSFV